MSNKGLPTPLTILALEEPLPVSGSNGKTYKLTRKESHYVCTCPAWTFMKAPVDVRSCKHLRQILGDAHEDSRCGPVVPKATKAKATPKSKAQGAPNKITTPKAEDRPSTSTSTLAPPAPKAAKVAPKRKLSPPPAPQLLPQEMSRAAKKVKQQEEEEKEVEELSEGDVSDLSLDEGEVGDKQVKLLLAHKFDLDSKKRDPKGWWMSEKLDGVRAYWDGQSQLFSRVGKLFYPPKAFTDQLPVGMSLDGELWSTRDSFDVTSGIVRSKGGEGWDAIKFMAFDVPSLGQLPFEERVQRLKDKFPDKVRTLAEQTEGPSDTPVGVVELVKQTECKGWDHLLAELKAVQAQDGEGLMLREPGSVYVGKRSTTLLKVKTFYDAEARVMGYEPGKGRLEGMTGALVCAMESGKTFSVGSGLDDNRRANPPKVGAIINYRFQELTKAGIPRFPTFVGEREDVDGPKDAIVRPKAIVAKEA